MNASFNASGIVCSFFLTVSLVIFSFFTGKRKILNYDRQRNSEEAVIEISISNARTDPVQIRIVEHINGDWVIKDQSHNYQKENASTIHFSISLDPGKKEYITYTYRKEWI